MTATECHGGTAREEHEQATSRDVKRDAQWLREAGWRRTGSPQQTSTKRVVDGKKNRKNGPTAGRIVELQRVNISFIQHMILARGPDAVQATKVRSHATDQEIDWGSSSG